MNALVENFKTQKGNSYGPSGVIDYGAVNDSLKTFGYSVEDSLSKGRYYIAKISKQGESFIFKMSTSEGINEALLNEKSWNEQMYSRSKNTDFLRIPQVIESGDFNSLSYIVTSFFEGERYVDLIQKGNDEGIDIIVKSHIYIDSLKDVKTYKNIVEDEMGKSFSSVKEKANSYITVAENFASEVNGHNLTPLITILRGYEQMDELGLNHNEFEPFNFIISNGKVCLYHGERASARSPRLFDVAIMYSKLYYTYGFPDLAKRYLSSFMEEYRGDSDYFKFAFKVMLASRVVGGYWDSSRNYENNPGLLVRINEDIINDRHFKF